MAAERIGLFGGSFDPIHWAHLVLAEWARVELNLAQVIFIPAYQNPLKPHPARASARQRWEMVQLAIADHPFFSASDVEISRPEPSFTIETVRYFRTRFPEPTYQLYFIAGKDHLNDLHRWREPEALLRLCRFLVFDRPEIPLRPEARPFLKAVDFLQGPLLDISASQIRQRCAAGKSIRYLVADSVYRYIEQHQLYR